MISFKNFRRIQILYLLNMKLFLIDFIQVFLDISPGLSNHIKTIIPANGHRHLLTRLRVLFDG